MKVSVTGEGISGFVGQVLAAVVAVCRCNDMNNLASSPLCVTPQSAFKVYGVATAATPVCKCDKIKIRRGRYPTHTNTHFEDKLHTHSLCMHICTCVRPQCSAPAL